MNDKVKKGMIIALLFPEQDATGVSLGRNILL